MTFKTKSFLVLIALAVVGMVAYSLSRSGEPLPSIDESANLFHSPIYTAWRDQLSEHKLIARAALPPIAPPETNAEGHRHFVDLWRQATLNSPDEVSELTSAIFLHSNLSTPLGEFLFQQLPAPSGNLLSYLESAQLQLRGDKRWDGVHYPAPSEDHLRYGNIPWQVAPGRLPFHLVRMGKPLYRGKSGFWRYLSPPEVTPEFMLFTKLHPHHLYVNLMRRSGNEGVDSAVLEALDRRHGACNVATFDKDSSFYWQQQKRESMASLTFKKEFVTQLTAFGGSYYWPQKLATAEWHNTLALAVEEVHTTHFNGKEELSRQERLDFIELTYLSILDALVATLNPPSINITCNHAIDRAPSLTVLWMTAHGMLTEQQIATELLAPPLLMRNRASHASRIGRFISAAQYLPRSDGDAQPQ